MATNNHKPQTSGIKVFKERDSLLTTLIEGNPQIRSLYNIITTFVIVFAITTIGDYISNTERFHSDFALLWWNVRDFYPHFTTPWLFMNCCLLCLLYPLVCLRHWLQLKHLRKLLSFEKDIDVADSTILTTKASQLGRWWSLALTTTYIAISGCGVVGYSSWYIVHHRVSISVSFALTMEMTRLVMKAHSYFVEKSCLLVSREEMAKLVKLNGQKKDQQTLSTPRLANLLYYLFAPTLIYRDSYPRFVLVHSGQMVLAVLVAFVTINRFLIDNFSLTGRETFAKSNLFRNIGSVFVLGVILKMVNFYAFLHLWHNITAELLRFADRRYYEPWWESISLSEYYRKWNTLVQDWLFAYIYFPVYKKTLSRSSAQYAVIFLSGIAHEYIVGFSIQFFFPMLFVFFAINGHILFMITRNLKRSNVHNIIFMLSTMFGWGVLSSLYSVEWYSRTNCPVMNSSLADHLVPRMFSCVKVK